MELRTSVQQQLWGDDEQKTSESGEPPDGDVWGGESVLHFCAPLATLPGRLPAFARRPFGLALEEPLPRPVPGNRYYDAIVRLPVPADERPVPVGLVSKSYSLVQHRDLALVLVRTLERLQIDPGRVKADVRMTEYGSRLDMELTLPGRGLDVDGRGRMDLTIRCFNSVDRSLPLRILIGWFRLVCSNGLVLGRSLARLRRLHDVSLSLDVVPETVDAVLAAAPEDEALLQRWHDLEVSEQRLRAWAESVVTRAWGKVAGLRLLHIARTGWDARLARPGRPTGRGGDEMVRTVLVPGSEPPNHNAFAIAQILAWIAKERREVGSRLEHQGAIPWLMASLTAPDIV
jgi:hypothetical protein